ncbi:MAG TPA: lanthionine synthetase LanC family protein [Pyrinomonadaceae bacterium]|nr:lanthionine synthetase LanC family protein [Pyrinomonadaceae bacterium]
MELWVRPGDWLISEGNSIATAMQMSLRFPKEFLGISPGFYMAHGNTALTEDGSQGIVRFYFNLTADGALRLMKKATWMLNQAQLAFNLKVLNDRQGYSRCDPVVLYIRKSDYGDVAMILSEIYQDISIHLKQRTPVFTKSLAPGVGLAEEPGQDFSFGEHRCRLVAEGIIRAYEQGKKLLDERFQAVAECFLEEALDLEKPFLNSGSSDDYHFQPQHQRQLTKSRGVKIASQLDFGRKAFLRTAEALASRLSQEAVWHGDRCNWLGAEPVDLTLAERQPKLSCRALGPELYDGTSGVALFLAELHAATGNVSARRTALGAIRQSLSRVDALPASRHIGLYTGAVGIAFAAARVGSILAEEELLEQAVDLLRNLAHEEHQACEFDLIGGTAGAIVALLTLREMLNDRSLLDFAVRLANNLLEQADKSGVGYSWGSPSSSKQRNLTGFSHGTAGVGYAFLELFHATGKTEYRTLAKKAFDYERHWFERSAGNWPDFREETGKGRRGNAPLSFATVWCHGAPGIALSRLRAFQILADETCKAEAITALETTRNAIWRWLHSGTENYSLCHGLAGNAETLIFGCEVLGQEVAGDHKVVAEVANAGVERYGKRGGKWPCGSGGEDTPSLMLGLAGIGYFYLRLHNPKIPSLLIMRPDNFSKRSRKVQHPPKQGAPVKS